jgi:TP901 family phage tail tape measure protein
MSTTTRNIKVKISAEIDAFNSKMKEFSGKIKDAQKEFEGLSKAGEGMTELGKKLMPATLAIGGIATVSAKTAMDFDSAMRQVGATMGFTSADIADKTSKNGKDFERLAECAREMGRTTQYSGVESAEALNYMALAGLSVNDSISLLPKVLNLASSGGMSLSVASDMVTDSMSALGLQVKDADSFVDKMAKTSQKSNTSVSQLGEAILTVGGTAKVLKGGVTEMNTALGILADNGVKGSEGGTALRNVILSLSAPTDKSAKLMKKLGLEVFDAEGNMRPLNDTFNDLSGILGTMTQEEQTKVLSELFNKTDLKSVNALLANSGERFSELSAEIDNSKNSAQNMAETMNSGAKGALTEMKSALEGVAEAIGQRITPFIESCADFISKLCGKFLELSPAMQNTIIIFGALLAVIPPLLVVGGTLLKWFTAIKVASVAFSVSMGTVTAGLLLIPTAIVAVVGAIAWLIANWDELPEMAKKVAKAIGDAWNSAVEWTKEKFSQMIDFLSEWWNNLMSNIGTWISNVCQSIGDGWNNAVEWTKEKWNNMLDFISEWWNNLVSSIGQWISNVTQPLVDGWNTCVETTKEIWEKATEIVSNVWETLKNLVTVGVMFIAEIIKAGVQIILLPWSFIWENCKEYVIPIFETIASFISEKLELIKTFVSEKLEAVKQFFTEKFEQAKQKTIEIYTNIADTISEKLEKAKQFVSEKLEAISNFFTEKWNKAKEKTTEIYTKISDSVKDKLDKAKSYAQEKTENIKNTISEKWNNAKDKTTEVYSNIAKAVGDKLEQAKSHTSSKLSSIKDYFSSRFEQSKSTVVDKMNNIRQSIQDKLNSAKDVANSVINNIKSKFDVFGTVANNVKSKFDSIRTGITNAINNARDAVSNAINKIKSILGITLSFPKIKMPHFTISGKFSLNPPSVPRFSVQWYNRGAIFKRKTVLPGGIGVGDASFGGVGNSPEAILPIKKLPELLGLDKNQQNAGLTLNISEFNNNRDYDIEKLADELAYYLNRKKAFGGAR